MEKKREKKRGREKEGKEGARRRPQGKERATDMIKSSKLLRRRYRPCDMNVGEPLLLKSYLAAQEKPLEEMTVESGRALYRRIGYTIVRAINKVSVVTPFALTAWALLCYGPKGDLAR